jgi:hypothetical protein
MPRVWVVLVPFGPNTKPEVVLLVPTALGVAELTAATDGRFLCKQQPALDVHILEGEGILGADQSRQQPA